MRKHIIRQLRRSIQTKCYGNHELCILSNLVRKSESLREVIFPFQETDFVCCDTRNWHLPLHNEKPYKHCRSEPWHNETTSSRWEYKHLSTACAALLQNSIARAAKLRWNWTFTLHTFTPDVYSVDFTAEICIFWFPVNFLDISKSTSNKHITSIRTITFRFQWMLKWKESMATCQPLTGLFTQ